VVPRTIARTCASLDLVAHLPERKGKTAGRAVVRKPQAGSPPSRLKSARAAPAADRPQFREETSARGRSACSLLSSRYPGELEELSPRTWEWACEDDRRQRTSSRSVESRSVFPPTTSRSRMWRLQVRRTRSSSIGRRLCSRSCLATSIVTRSRSSSPRTTRNVGAGQWMRSSPQPSRPKTTPVTCAGSADRKSPPPRSHPQSTRWRGPDAQQLRAARYFRP
jgi:hypothetical protein